MSKTLEEMFSDGHLVLEQELDCDGCGFSMSVFETFMYLEPCQPLEDGVRFVRLCALCVSHYIDIGDIPGAKKGATMLSPVEQRSAIEAASAAQLRLVVEELRALVADAQSDLCKLEASAQREWDTDAICVHLKALEDRHGAELFARALEIILGELREMGWRLATGRGALPGSRRTKPLYQQEGEPDWVFAEFQEKCRRWDREDLEFEEKTIYWLVIAHPDAIIPNKELDERLT